MWGTVHYRIVSHSITGYYILLTISRNWEILNQLTLYIDILYLYIIIHKWWGFKPVQNHYYNLFLISAWYFFVIKWFSILVVRLCQNALKLKKLTVCISRVASNTMMSLNLASPGYSIQDWSIFDMTLTWSFSVISSGAAGGEYTSTCTLLLITADILNNTPHDNLP